MVKSLPPSTVSSLAIFALLFGFPSWMETIKRPLEDDLMSPSPAAKRRVLASGDGSPVAVAADNRDIDVELFQKEALWRQMRQYAREKERAEEKVLDLQRKQEATEAALGAMEATWTELLSTIQERVGGVSSAPPVENLLRLDRYATMDVLATQFKSPLAERARSTIALVDQRVNTRVKVEAGAVDYQVEARLAREEADVKNTELQLLRNRLQQTQADVDRYKESLSEVEKKLDRVQSKTVLAMESKGKSVKEEPAKVGTPQEVQPKQEQQDQQEQQDVSMDPPPLTNGHVHEVDKEQWQLRAHEREVELRKAAEERLQLSAEIRVLKDRLAIPQRETILASADYEALMAEAKEWRQQCEEAQAFVKPVIDRLERLMNERTEYREKTEADLKKKTEELELNLEKRNYEFVRLREKWEALHAEKEVLKSREVEKLKSTAELKTLVSSCEQRIGVLQSEVKRLRSRLAAQAGDGDLLAFLIGSGPDAFAQQETAKQLLDARKRIESLESQLRPDQRGVEDVLEKSRKFDAMFGTESAFPPDVQSMAANLAAKEEELRKAKLRLQDDDAAADALYSEIDRISAAFDTLEKQNKSRAFDLSDLEEKVKKLAGEKAQEQNKYYTEKKAQQAASAEQQAVLRTNQRQQATIDRFVDTVKSQNTLLSQNQLEATKLTATLREWQNRTKELNIELARWKARGEEAEKRNTMLGHQMRDGQIGFEKKREEARKALEDLKIAREEAAKAALKAKTAPVVTSSAGPEVQAMAKENETLKSILKCSTCKNEFRSHILLKCMHTFCKECIDARIKNRSRKCPCCNLAFAQSEAQQFYFQ